ncbi:UNVERIFIED_CONTAM: hypothetical protein Sindi_0453500 [Sesamum indicum]
MAELLHLSDIKEGRRSKDILRWEISFGEAFYRQANIIRAEGFVETRISSTSCGLELMRELSFGLRGSN